MITTRTREGGPKQHRDKQKWPRETHSVTYIPGLSTLSDLWRSLRRYSSVAQGHLHIFHPAQLRSPSYSTSTYFRYQHPSDHTVLIYSFHLPKPTQYSDLLANSLSIPAILRASSFLTLSIRDTAANLLKHLISRKFYFSSLSTSHTQCLYSVQRRLYNYPFIYKLLGLYPKSSITQHTFQCSPRTHSEYHIPFT